MVTVRSILSMIVSKRDSLPELRGSCWNKTHKNMKWKLALGIATSPSDRWLRKAADWNPELRTRYRINRAIGRPRERWEDDNNEFLKQEFEDTKNPIESSNQTNKTWISIAIDRGPWKNDGR